jgi:hypothetical protein
MRMERVPTQSEEILAYRAGGLRAMLFAGVCCLGGVVLLRLAALLMRREASLAGLLALAATGLAVGGAIGLVRSLRRRGIMLDRADGQATVWQRRLLRRSATRRELGAFWTVLLSPGRVQERFASRTVYLVGLHGEVGEPLLMSWDTDYQAARRFADEVAAFLQFPLSDVTSTERVIHPPGKTDTPPPAAPTVPRGVPAPTTLQCGIEWHDDTLVLEEPRVGRWERIGGPLVVFLLQAPVLLGIGTYAHFFSETPRVFLDPLITSAIVVGMLLVIVVAVVLGSLPQLGQRRIVEASADGLHFRTEGMFARKYRHMRREDIRELRIAFGHLAAVTPRDYRVICGRLHHPLARAELEWLRDQLTQALYGPGGMDWTQHITRG